MEHLAADLGSCIGFVLGREPGRSGGETSGDALLDWRQRLAEDGFALVEVAEPATFALPGPWIALYEDEAGEARAAVLFGVPSGVLLDPSGELGATLVPQRGFVVTPLALSEAPSRSAGAGRLEGRVAAVMIAPARQAPLVRVERATVRAGRGIDGDRYAAGEGTFSHVGRGFDLTLVESEALAELVDDLPWEAARRNIVTTGISLDELVGRPFRIGDVQCVGRRLAEPCAHLEQLTRPGVLRALVHRAGLRADVLSDGQIAVGDVVTT